MLGLLDGLLLKTLPAVSVPRGSVIVGNDARRNFYYAHDRPFTIQGRHRCSIGVPRHVDSRVLARGLHVDCNTTRHSPGHKQSLEAREEAKMKAKV